MRLNVPNLDLPPMHIRCERCKAEYEVDGAQMRGGRLEVQCSACAHIFTVDRHTGPKNPSSVSGGPWIVETVGGSVLHFADLAAVQQRIQEKALTQYDKITHDRRTWQALGEVAELAPFFGSATADAANETRGCEPLEPAAANETSRFVLEPKSRGALKVSLGLAVAAGVAFAGIRWQQDRHPVFQSRQAHAALPVPVRPAASSLPVDKEPEDQGGPGPAPATAASTAGHRPVVEALPSPPEPVAKKAPPAPAPAVPTTHVAESYEKLVAEADRALENGANSKARELYQRALSHRPAGFKAITGLGFVALDRGQLPVAYEYFKRALTTKTSYPPALFGIAEVHRARGEKTLALHSYQRYLDMSPDGADAPAARRHLQKLRSER
jgi:predicted Zn finger-like uncharacterized protein